MTTNPKRNNPQFAFFGTSHIAAFVLDELERAGLVPTLIVTPPDQKQGRGLTLAACAVKEWALAREISLLQPERLDETFVQEMHSFGPFDACVVVDYGKILPRTVLDIPKRGFLNVHPSLLPRLRGASPMRSAILNDEKRVGVSVMLVDEKMDHGPIVAQKAIEIADWPPKNSQLEHTLMSEGGTLLSQVLVPWIAGDIEAREQNHDLATFSGKFTKEDGRLDLSADPYTNLLKIRAFENWPGTYAFFERGGKEVRVQIFEAHLQNGMLLIDTVKPEGKTEMPYADFIRSGATPRR